MLQMLQAQALAAAAEAANSAAAANDATVSLQLHLLLMVWLTSSLLQMTFLVRGELQRLADLFASMSTLTDTYVH